MTSYDKHSSLLQFDFNCGLLKVQANLTQLFYGTLTSHQKFYKILQNFTKFYKFLQIFTNFYKFLHNFTKVN